MPEFGRLCAPQREMLLLFYNLRKLLEKNQIQSQWHASPGDFNWAVVPALLGAVVPVEGVTGENESSEARG